MCILIYHKYDTTIVKNDHLSFCHDFIIKIFSFCDFSGDIDYNSKTDVFRDVLDLIINQCGLSRSKGTSGGLKVSANRTAQASEVACNYKTDCICNAISSRITGYMDPVGGEIL